MRASWKKYNKFKSSFEDIEVLIEMAADEGGEDMIDEIQSELKNSQGRS